MGGVFFYNFFSCVIILRVHYGHSFFDDSYGGDRLGSGEESSLRVCRVGGFEKNFNFFKKNLLTNSKLFEMFIFTLLTAVP